MKSSFLLLCLCLTGAINNAQPLTGAVAQQTGSAKTPRIQVAILLDVSGSMDGLIDQAKTQLWSMVETLGKASCDGKKPAIEIALYEYGRPENGVAANYIKAISPFTSDLDSLSAKLFGLHTGGGDEYCGAVMVQSLNNLGWDAGNSNYKVIFIAGNESFRQGGISWTEACTLAKQKSVIINTIYCGNRQDGIKEFWQMGGECGSGTYSNIDQNQKMENISTPQDSMIYVLNGKLNGSYTAYNSASVGRIALQSKMDQANFSMGYAIMAKRAKVKANSAAYNNDSWDLIDAARADSSVFNKLERQYLPDSLQKKSTAELKQYVQQKNAERAAIQNQINTLAAEREKYIANVRKKQANASKEQNLENAIQQTIRTQAIQYNMRFEQ